MDTTTQLTISKGSPYPFGISSQGEGINFALISTHADAITLCLFNRDTQEKIAEIPLNPETHKTGDVWHVLVNGLPSRVAYGYLVKSPFENAQHLLLDPYARALSTHNAWGQYNSPFDARHDYYTPLGDVILVEPFDWENDEPPQIPINELIIYEMHVRAFTKDPSSHAQHPGTFLGVIEKIPHLLDLGVNAVEFLPVQEFNELEYRHTHPSMTKQLYNFWGYSTANFFSPMNRYASNNDPGTAVREFKTMVKELHRHNIEVILDIVFNHTGEGNEKGFVFSFKGIDNPIYYLLDQRGKYLDFSGCGNSINANHPIVLEMIIDCLRYWTTEMHVDGFRFDLASALTRDSDGKPLNPAPLIQAISQDPLLANIKLIAEPWDAAGLYQVGYFAPESKRWCEWNGKYRDSVRKFIKGQHWTHGEFAMRLCGSEDLYHSRVPSASINFITAHDGFTLADLVSYNSKHNLDNGENNRDGSDDNFSWNCGIEGATTNKKILSLRERQMRNFHLALMISQGVPMLHMGDEYEHTKQGNNNTWCQDNNLNWFQWDKLQEKASFYRFYRALIHFRKGHFLLQRKSFLTNRDVDWHSVEPFKPDWNSSAPFVALTLKDQKNGHDLYIAFNPQDHAASIKIPPATHLRTWRWVVNTANPPPNDIYEDENGPIMQNTTYKMPSYSAIMLEAL